MNGDDILQRETGHTLYIRTIVGDSRPGLWDSHKQGMNALIGGVDWQDESKYPRSENEPYVLRIPLLFFFFGKTPLPICAMRFQEPKVRIRFRKCREFLAEDPGKELSMTIRLRMEGGYLTEKDRSAFLSRGHDMLMDDMHVFEYDSAGNVNDIVRPEFFNPGKCLFFTMQDSEVLNSDDLFNFARDNTKLQRDLMNSVKLTIQGNVIASQEVATHDFMRTSQFHYSFPGGPILDLNALIYVLNFCNRPLDLQPSSHIMLNETHLEIRTNLPLRRGLLFNKVRVTVYALTVNVIRFRDGFVKKLWSNPKNYR